MGLTWPSNADGFWPARNRPDSSRPGLLAAAELPASAQAYHVGDSQWQARESTENGHVTLLSVSGRLGSVVKGSARSSAAASLLVRLSSAEWSTDVSPRSPATTLYRGSQVPDAKSLDRRKFFCESGNGLWGIGPAGTRPDAVPGFRPTAGAEHVTLAALGRGRARGDPRRSSARRVPDRGGESVAQDHPGLGDREPTTRLLAEPGKESAVSRRDRRDSAAPMPLDTPRRQDRIHAARF